MAKFIIDIDVVSLGREDGYLEAVALGNRENVFSVKCGSAMNSCCFIDEYNVVR